MEAHLPSHSAGRRRIHHGTPTSHKRHICLPRPWCPPACSACSLTRKNLERQNPSIRCQWWWEDNATAVSDHRSLCILVISKATEEFDLIWLKMPSELVFTTWFLQPLLVQDNGVLILSSQGCLCDVVGAIVFVDLSVLPINIGLRQGAQALQELRVEHQIVRLQHVLGQLQFCRGPHKAVRLRTESAEDALRTFLIELWICIHLFALFCCYSVGCVAVRRREKKTKNKNDFSPCQNSGEASELTWCIWRHLCGSWIQISPESQTQRRHLFFLCAHSWCSPCSQSMNQTTAGWNHTRLLSENTRETRYSLLGSYWSNEQWSERGVMIFHI